jgi:hypothetical protein
LVIGATASAARALAADRAAAEQPVVSDGRLATARSADDVPDYFLAITSAPAAARA